MGLMQKSNLGCKRWPKYFPIQFGAFWELENGWPLGEKIEEKECSWKNGWGECDLLVQDTLIEKCRCWFMTFTGSFLRTFLSAESKNRECRWKWIISLKSLFPFLIGYISLKLTIRFFEQTVFWLILDLKNFVKAL